MDKKSDSTKASSTNEQNISSKLRRLKIQESILVQDLQKTEQQVLLENSKSLISETNSVTYLSSNSDVPLKVKNSYTQVKILFEDINTLTNSRELLADMDISDMKDKVLEFENKLKSLKTMVNMELKTLKNLEHDIIKQLHEEPHELDNIKHTNRKVASAKFSDIVPSPVRVLMTSPLKCVEVQEFQDFMKGSGNRYGGWNEYNHNIFVKFWQKRFGANYDSVITDDGDILMSDAYEMFIQELDPKLQGVTVNDIKTHIKWYKKYLLLKGRQQKAIEKWKGNRKSIKNVHNEDFEHKKENLVKMKNISIRAESEAEKKMIASKRLKRRSFSLDRKIDGCDDSNKKNSSTFMKPTAQWLYRTYDDDNVSQSSVSYSIENIEKLCIPNWRQNL